MFAEVDVKDMVVDKKYAILVRNDPWTYRTGTFKETKVFHGQIFHYVKVHDGIQNVDTYSALRNIQNKNKTISYYTFVPQKERITQAMETRALQKMLQCIVNDDFTWL